ncbi:hypothetical protein CDO28_17900 [Sinorhizobium meliloti]|nr:hypothetical protein CDO28_17900 [Sinorhizobium meliloti]MQW54560.1 hypothetical protein [Sinorhizobium meliloti]
MNPDALQFPSYTRAGCSDAEADTRQANWRRANPGKYDAHLAVQRAVKTGELEKQTCAVCGVEAVDAHHDQYDERPKNWTMPPSQSSSRDASGWRPASRLPAFIAAVSDASRRPKRKRPSFPPWRTSMRSRRASTTMPRVIRR